MALETFAFVWPVRGAAFDRMQEEDGTGSLEIRIFA